MSRITLSCCLILAATSQCLGATQASEGLPYLRLQDHNVSVLQLSGLDQELSEHHAHEHVIVHMFLAAQPLSCGSVEVRGFVLREPLAQELQQGRNTHPTILSQKWTPSISLIDDHLRSSYRLEIIDEVSGVVNKLLGRNSKQTESPWNNLVPYQVQALLPGSVASQTLRLCLRGWHTSALYTVQLGNEQVKSFARQHPSIWEVMAKPSLVTSPEAYAIQVAKHAALRQPSTRTLIWVTPDYATALSKNRQVAGLIRSGDLQLLLWDAFNSCEGFPRCTTQRQFADTLLYANQPLMTALAELLLWRSRAVLASDKGELWRLEKAAARSRPAHAAAFD